LRERKYMRVKKKYSEPKTKEEKNLEKDIMRKVVIYARPVLFFA